MLGIAWPYFIIASLLIIITPGQDMMLVMSRSISQGVAAGVATAFGVSVGLLGHTILVSLGLGAILQSWQWLFTAIKFVGALYLIYLGITLWRSKINVSDASLDSAHSPWRLFVSGAMSNLLNPKIVVFYFAFLPQFVLPHAAHPTPAVFVLGLSFALLTFLVKAPVAYFAGRLSGWLRARPDTLQGLYRGSGVLMVVLGLRLMFVRANS